VGRLAQTLAALWRLTGARHLNLIAAGVAFYALLAVFPALAATLAIAGLIIDPTVVAEFLSLAADFLPQDALDLLDAQATRLLSADASALGWTTVASVVFAIWSARRGVNALAQGLTAIHGGQSRAGLGDVLVALSLTVVLILVGVVALVAVFLTPIILALLSIVLPADSWLPAITEALRWVVAVMVLVVGLGLFYRYGPNRPGQPRSPFFSVGMAVALALWVAASVGFNLFLANFSNYNEVYGSIGAVVALLMWFYISAYAVLIGAAVNSLIEAPEGQAGKG
jgi:membrane protein